MVAGNSPQSAADVNQAVGSLCRQVIGIRDQVARFQTYMVATDLKAAPLSMASADEANIKSAISVLNTALQALDYTFVNRLNGLF